MMNLLRSQLEDLGLKAGDIALVHSSFRSLGVRDPEAIIAALLETLGPAGTLLMPALTYMQNPPYLHDTRHTPSCVGYLTEYFRCRAGTRRSLHPTHSVCAAGAQAQAMLGEHGRDRTPCGEHSPFRGVIERGGKILMLGCSLRPNTTMHAVEEYVRPPYLFGSEREYVITDRDGSVFRKTYITHGFEGFQQRYDRAAALLTGAELRSGKVGDAESHLLDAAALHRRSVERMRMDPFCFVDRVPDLERAAP